MICSVLLNPSLVRPMDTWKVANPRYGMLGPAVRDVAQFLFLSRDNKLPSPSCPMRTDKYSEDCSQKMELYTQIGKCIRQVSNQWFRAMHAPRFCSQWLRMGWGS